MSTENLKVTEIKRLKQRGKDFVPITLAEAVVVNTQHIPGFSTMEITTLDKILGQYGYNLTQFNQALQNKQNQLEMRYQRIVNHHNYLLLCLLFYL